MQLFGHLPYQTGKPGNQQAFFSMQYKIVKDFMISKTIKIKCRSETIIIVVSRTKIDKKKTRLPLNQKEMMKSNIYVTLTLNAKLALPLVTKDQK